MWVYLLTFWELALKLTTLILAAEIAHVQVQFNHRQFTFLSRDVCVLIYDVWYLGRFFVMRSLKKAARHPAMGECIACSSPRPAQHCMHCQSLRWQVEQVDGGLWEGRQPFCG